MENAGNSSSKDTNNNGKEGDDHEPEVMPPDLQSAQQKAQERGHWLREAIVKGGVSGAVRVILDRGIDHLSL